MDIAFGIRCAAPAGDIKAREESRSGFRPLRRTASPCARVRHRVAAEGATQPGSPWRARRSGSPALSKWASFSRNQNLHMHRFAVRRSSRIGPAFAITPVIGRSPLAAGLIATGWYGHPVPNLGPQVTMKTPYTGDSGRRRWVPWKWMPILSPTSHFEQRCPSPGCPDLAEQAVDCP